MPFLMRNEIQSQPRYAAPARPMTPTMGAPAMVTATAPPAVTVARAPLRLDTTLLRWTSELTQKSYHMEGKGARGRADTGVASPQTRSPQPMRLTRGPSPANSG